MKFSILLFSLFLSLCPELGSSQVLDWSKEDVVLLRGALEDEVGTSKNPSAVIRAMGRVFGTKDARVHIAINSQGGSLAAGMEIARAMDVGRAMGIKTHCAVLRLAASMAFGLLSMCDEIYFVSGSWVMWHRVYTRPLPGGGSVFDHMSQELADETRKRFTRTESIFDAASMRRFGIGVNEFLDSKLLEYFWPVEEFLATFEPRGTRIVAVIKLPPGLDKGETWSPLENKAPFHGPPTAGFRLPLPNMSPEP